MPRKKKTNAFTLVEMLIVVVILGIIVSITVPEIVRATRESKATQCGSALRLIEAAKEQWRRDFPGAGNPTETQLLRYFPGTTLPADPWGVGFENVTELNVLASHSYNNNASYEPADNCSAENGYNDCFQIQH